MDFVFEKINATMKHKNHLIDIYSVRKKIHETVDCVIQLCDCSQYLDNISVLIENMENQQELTVNEKEIFLIQVKNTKELFYFLTKLTKSLVLKFISFKKMFFLTAISFEVEKIKTFFSVLNKIEKLEEKFYVLEKAFL